LRFIEKIVEALSEDVRFWITINEPLVYIYHSYFIGVWPPEEKSFLSARRITNNMAESHVAAYKIIHDIYRKKKIKPPLVSIAKNIQAFEPYDNSLKNRLAVFLRDKSFNLNLVVKLLRARSLDYLGINYYTRGLVNACGWSINNIFRDKKVPSQLKKNSLGWDIYPEGLKKLLIRFKKFKLPILITENGICTEDDALRWEFIVGHLKSIHDSIQDGVSIFGYIHWSLMDNFEWDKGFTPRFGLIEVDYNNYERKIRESAKKFSEVCANGVLDL
jgi:beta-glucosidase